jgi:outer membrane protein OmpA-like peptidoglycan-associated protein
MTRYLAAAAVLACVGPAEAQVWFGAEAPLALATSDTQRELFAPGFLPAAGIYAGHRNAALGLRVRAGFLADAATPAPGDHQDPGAAGLVSSTLAGRLRVGAVWLEAAAGGGVTGHTLAPTFEFAAGWTVLASKLELGPSARYVRVVSTDPMNAFGTAELVLLGVDVKLGRSRARAHATDKPRAVRVAAVAGDRSEPGSVAAPAPVTPPVPITADDDRLVDSDTTCLEDLVGCDVPEGMEVHVDRIILDERVLFDLDRARVKSAGRDLVRKVVELWKANPTWVRMTIEGHTDVRGRDTYNLALSELRARRVRAIMLELGAPDAIDIVGFGRSRPRDLGHDEAAHRRNRRVEFVIERRLP